MTSVAKNIFRAIHEGKWLYIEYQNKAAHKTKYMIAVYDIDLEYKSLSVTGLHIGDYSTKELTIYIDSILFSKILDGTYYKTNARLIEDIALYPQKYTSLFSNIPNLKTLQYLSDCNKLSDLPKLNTEYELVKQLDASKITKCIYKLDDEQFRHFIHSFKKKAETKSESASQLVLQIALNVLSIHLPKGLYVLAYREVRLDVEKKTLIAGNIKICSEFSIATDEHNISQGLSIHKFLDSDDMILLDDFEANAELIKNTITEHLKKHKSGAVDDLPYFLCIQRDINANLEKEYEAILAMYAEQKVTEPIQAFFGELRSIKPNDEILPIALIDKKVNLDQLLAIHNAINYPVAYIQGPPGTGKTTTIINTIITAFFNTKTVLFSSYNNHPIDGVFEKLASLTYKGYTIPFPILRIGSNARVPDTCSHIKKLISMVERLTVFEDVLKQNKQVQLERTKKLTELLQKYERQIDLRERAELIESMLSKNENMSLRLVLQGQQESEIYKELSLIGNINEEDALSLLDFDRERLLQYVNYASVKLIKKLFTHEYKDFMEIIYMQNEEKQISAFNTFFSKSENVERIKKVFPVFCATCISSQKIGMPQTYFDMTIIDEASQCNTAISLISIIRGKSLMLVGDPQQLNPVITLDKTINEELKAKYQTSDTYDYIKNSCYKAFLASDSVSQETLLRNHYRCAKEIIQFNNTKYYNNQLCIRSKTLDEKPLVFCDVKENYASEKNTSPQEAKKIVEYVACHLDKNIGIITPFKNQKELIEYELKERGLDQKVSCGTVHTFQGDEKDEILFSLALTDNTYQKTYDWLKNNRELINVAVSRAKDKLVIFSSSKELERLHTKDEGDDLYELTKYVQQNGEYTVTARETTSRALGIKPYSTETENAFLTTLNHALSNVLNENAKYTVKREVQLSHLFEKNKKDCDFFYKGSLDFVIYKKGFRGKEEAMLAIELNGPEHSEDDKVIERDNKKKQICKNHGFELICVDNTYARRYNFIKDILEGFFIKK